MVRRRFPHELSSVPLARRDLLAWLRASGASPGTGCDSAAVVATELAANAILHAAPLPDGTFEVAWGRLGQRLTIEVTDAGGPQVPHLADTEAESPMGRGLRIVESLTLVWGVSHRGSRRTVHAELPMEWPRGG